MAAGVTATTAPSPSLLGLRVPDGQAPAAVRFGPHVIPFEGRGFRSSKARVGHDAAQRDRQGCPAVGSGLLAQVAADGGDGLGVERLGLPDALAGPRGLPGPSGQGGPDPGVRGWRGVAAGVMGGGDRAACHPQGCHAGALGLALGQVEGEPVRATRQGLVAVLGAPA